MDWNSVAQRIKNHPVPIILGFIAAVLLPIGGLFINILSPIWAATAIVLFVVIVVRVLVRPAQGTQPPDAIASEPDNSLATDTHETTTMTAHDYVNLGEHLWYLANSLDQNPQSIGNSIAAFSKGLEQCGFNGTRAAAKSIEHTTVGQLQSQMASISSSLYGEATTTQAAFIKLGEFVWYLCNPTTATTQEFETSINGFLQQLDKCGLDSKAAANPLQNLRYVYFRKVNLVAGRSLDELASIMKTIRHRLEHETRNLSIDE